MMHPAVFLIQSFVDGRMFRHPGNYVEEPCSPSKLSSGFVEEPITGNVGNLPPSSEDRYQALIQYSAPPTASNDVRSLADLSGEREVPALRLSFCRSVCGETLGGALSFTGLFLS